MGTPDYIAPEVLQDGNNFSRAIYGKQGDMWGFGVSLFELLTGELPFYSQSLMQTYNNIQNHSKHLKLDEYTILSCEAKDLLSKLLCDAKIRINLEDVKKHAFFREIDWDSIKTADPPFKPVACEDLREYLMDTDTIESCVSAFGEAKRIGLEGRLKMQLSYIGFTWPGSNLSILPKDFKGDAVTLTSQSLKNSASSVALSRISISESSLLLKDDPDGSREGRGLDDDRPLVMLTQELAEQEAQLHAQLLLNDELRQKIETLRLANEIDRKKINELVRKLEEALTMGSPLSSRRSSECSAEKKLLKQKDQEIQSLEQKLLQERLARKILASEAEKLRQENDELLKEVEKHSKVESESLATSGSFYGTPVKETQFRSRNTTGGSFNILRAFIKQDQPSSPSKIPNEGDLKVLMSSERKGKIKEEWQNCVCFCAPDGFYSRDTKGHTRKVVSFDCHALWAQPCSAKELPRIPAKKTLGCFKVRITSNRESETVLPKERVEASLSSCEIEASLTHEQKLLKGAIKMLSVTDAEDTRNAISEQIQSMESTIKSLQCRLERIGICSDGPQSFACHVWTPADRRGLQTCQICFRDNIVAEFVECGRCGLKCHKFCSSELIPSCDRIAALSNSRPIYLMAKNGEEAKRWIRGINHDFRLYEANKLK